MVILNHLMIHDDLSRHTRSSKFRSTFDSILYLFLSSHYDMNPKGRDREGYVVGGIQKPRPTGFTEDTKISKPLDNFRDERLTHYHLDPYQVRYVYSFKQ